MLSDFRKPCEGFPKVCSSSAVWSKNAKQNVGYKRETNVANVKQTLWLICKRKKNVQRVCFGFAIIACMFRA